MDNYSNYSIRNSQRKTAFSRKSSFATVVRFFNMIIYVNPVGNKGKNQSY